MRCDGATLNMPKPKMKSKGRGRPSTGVEPLRSIVSLKGSSDLEKWLDELTEAGKCATRSHAIRRALEEFALKVMPSKPMPKR